ncbi:hypothetical protein ACI797_20245 [Geodermatophilus sp. SYSU D00691]
MTSEARGRTLAEDVGGDTAVPGGTAERAPDVEEARTSAPGTGTTDEVEDAAEDAAPRRRPRRRPRVADPEPDEGVEEATTEDEDEDDDDRGRRLSLPLVPVLAVLLVLLLGAVVWLWTTRPEESPVRTDDYVDVLQAARSGVVDLTSFDYVTIDDDIEEARRITTGDLREETVQQLDSSRQQLTDSEAVVQTEVVGAAVTRADAERGTVLLVIQSTQKTNAAEQAQVVRYRVEVELAKEDGRWLLSGLTGR